MGTVPVREYPACDLAYEFCRNNLYKRKYCETLWHRCKNYYEERNGFSKGSRDPIKMLSGKEERHAMAC